MPTRPDPDAARALAGRALRRRGDLPARQRPDARSGARPPRASALLVRRAGRTVPVRHLAGPQLQEALERRQRPRPAAAGPRGGQRRAGHRPGDAAAADDDRVELVGIELALPRDGDPVVFAHHVLEALAFSVPTAVEVPPVAGWQAALDVLADDGAERAKFRTGGPTGAQIPTPEPSSRSLSSRAVDRQLPFKLPPACTTRSAAPSRPTGSSSTASSTCCWPPSPRRTAAHHGGRRGAARPRRPDPLLARARRRRPGGVRRSLVSFGSAASPTRRRPGRARAARRGRAVTAATAWFEVPAGLGFPVQHLPYGVLSPARGAARVRGPHRRPRARPRRRRPAADADFRRRGRSNAFLAPGPTAGRRCATRLHRAARRPGPRAAVEPHLRPLDGVDACTCRSTVADYVDFYSSEHHAQNVGRDLPPRQRGRCRRTGSTCRSATTAAPGTVVVSGTAVVRPVRPAQGRRTTARRPSGRRQRLDIEAEVGFVVGVPSALGPAGAHQRLRRPRLRRRAGQRLVGARHPGLGVRPARPVPRQVLRDLGRRPGSRRWPPSPRARVAAAGAGPAAARLPARPATPGRSTSTLEVELERRRCVCRPAVRRHVLDARPAARPPDRQRRLAAHRRPARVRHRQRARARAARVAPRADLGGARAAAPVDGIGAVTFLEDGDERHHRRDGRRRRRRSR